MIIKKNYLYRKLNEQNPNALKEYALGGDDCLLVGDTGTVSLEFYMRNNGKLEDKYVSVFEEEWDKTPKKIL